jgi:hypothetical protein
MSVTKRRSRMPKDIVEADQGSVPFGAPLCLGDVSGMRVRDVSGKPGKAKPPCILRDGSGGHQAKLALFSSSLFTR